MNTEEFTKEKRYGDLLGTCSRCSTVMKGSTRLIFGILPVSGWVM